jgi:hypothetical protein
MTVFKIDIQANFLSEFALFRGFLKTGKAFDQEIHSLGFDGCNNQANQRLKLFISEGILRGLRTIDVDKAVRIIRLRSKGGHPDQSGQHV